MNIELFGCSEYNQRNLTRFYSSLDMLIPPVTLNVSEMVVKIVELQVWLCICVNVFLNDELGVVALVILIDDLLLFDVLYRPISIDKERFEKEPFGLCHLLFHRHVV